MRGSCCHFSDEKSGKGFHGPCHLAHCAAPSPAQLLKRASLSETRRAAGLVARMTSTSGDPASVRYPASKGGVGWVGTLTRSDLSLEDGQGGGYQQHPVGPV